MSYQTKQGVQAIVDDLPHDKISEADRLLVEANLWESYGFHEEANEARAQSETVRTLRHQERQVEQVAAQVLRIVIDALEDAYERMVPS